MIPQVPILGNWRCHSLSQKESRIYESVSFNDEFNLYMLGLRCQWHNQVKLCHRLRRETWAQDAHLEVVDLQVVVEAT